MLFAFDECKVQQMFSPSIILRLPMQFLQPCPLWRLCHCVYPYLMVQSSMSKAVRPAVAQTIWPWWLPKCQPNILPRGRPQQASESCRSISAVQHQPKHAHRSILCCFQPSSHPPTGQTIIILSILGLGLRRSRQASCLSCGDITLSKPLTGLDELDNVGELLEGHNGEADTG